MTDEQAANVPSSPHEVAHHFASLVLTDEWNQAQELIWRHPLVGWPDHARLRQMLTATGTFDQVERLDDQWARVWYIVDAPAGHLEGPEQVAAWCCTLRRTDEGWRVYYIGHRIPLEDLPRD